MIKKTLTVLFKLVLKACSPLQYGTQSSLKNVALTTGDKHYRLLVNLPKPLQKVMFILNKKYP